MKKTRVVVFLGLLISMDVILTHLVPVIQWQTIRVSFGFLPESFSSMLFGPLIGGIGAVLGDLLGMLVAPKGPFFPGFTFSALLTGVIYGIFLYKKPKTILNISLAVVFTTLLVDFGLNTYWLTILYGKGFFVILPGRIIKSLVMLPVQISMIYALWRYAGRMIENRFIKNKV
jgi:ECF transporter S component (folate family)